MGERLLEIKQTATDDDTIREFDKFNRCEKHVLSSINAKVVNSCTQFHDEVENITTKNLLQYESYHFDDQDINCCLTPYAGQEPPELIIDELWLDVFPLTKQPTGIIPQHNQMTVYCSHKSVMVDFPEKAGHQGDATQSTSCSDVNDDVILQSFVGTYIWEPCCTT